jgi:hypothetical protein
LVRTISNVLVMEIGWTDVGSGGYILVSCAHSNTSLNSIWYVGASRMNCFRYLKLMSPLNAAICTNLERQKCYGTGKKILFKKHLFDLEVKGQGPTKVITVRDTLTVILV